jgi:uncharacterized membrane protein
LLAGSGVIFFFAYNWTVLPRLVRFGIVEGLLLAAFAIAWWKGSETAAGRAALFFTAILTGALFALIGQTYQLGADPWQLFAIWAVLLLPWAFAARQPDLWLLSLLLANVALGLRPWFNFNPTWIFCLFNLAAQAVWEWVAPEPRWGIRIVGTVAGVAITVLTVTQIFGTLHLPFALGYLVWLATIYSVYTKHRPDLYLVAGALLSAIVTMVCLLAHELSWLHGDYLGGALLIAVVVIVLSGAAAKWLQHLAKSDPA